MGPVAIIGISAGTALVVNIITNIASKAMSDKEFEDVNGDQIRKVVEDEITIYAEDTMAKFDEMKRMLESNYVKKSDFDKLKEEVNALYECVNKMAMK